jgi:hypothetical protein
MPDLIKEVRASAVAPRYLLHGLSLPGAVLKALVKRGIYCQPGVSLEHQHRAARYVLRGVESGGAVSDMGRACIFVSPDGMSLPWLQKLDSFAVNGRHAIFLAESLVRIDMLRVGKTCDVVITAHTLSREFGRARPEIQSTLLFRGRDGVLPAELWRPEHRAMRGEVVPVFYNRAGEVSDPPKAFKDAMKRASACVCCIGCRHSHAGVPPVQGVG